MKKYQLGDKWSNDFDYDGLIRSCNDADVSWGADKLEKLYDSLVDVNYHDLARDVDKAVEHLRREDEGDMAVAIESLDKVRETIKKDYFEHESGYVNTEVDEEGNERVVLYDDKGESKGSFASEKQALKYAKEIGLSPDVMAKGGEVRRSPIRKLAFEMFNKEYSELSSKDQKQVEDKREDLMDKDYNAYKKKYYAKGGSTKAEYVVTLSNPADSTPSGKKSFTLKASSPEEARKIATDIIKKDFGYYVSIGYRDIRIKRKMAKGGYIPFEERADFFDYVSAFYGAGGIYAQSYNGGFEDDEIKVAIDKYIQDPNTNWGGGDSVDRELMRDRYLAPTYAKGGEIKPRRKRKFDIGNRDKRQKVDTISGDRAMTVRYYNKGKFGVEKLVSIERGLREINDNIRYGVPYEDYSRNNQIHYEFFNNNDNRSLANRKSAIFETKLMAKGGALDKEFKFTKNFVIYVPSTSNVGDTISKSELEKRVKEVEKYVADEFGGYTETETEGGYKSTSGDIIEEDVVKVSVFAQNDDWQKNEGKVVAKVKEWANKWGQEAIGFEYEGDLYYIDDDGKFTLGGVLMAGIAGYVGYKIGRARPQKKGFETEKAVGRKFGKKFKRKKKMAEGGGLKKNMKVWDVFKDGVLQGRVKTSRTDEEGVIEFYLNSISKRVLKPTIKKHWSAKVSDEKYQFAKGGQIDNAYLNASKKDELFIEAVKNGKVIEYPIKAKTVKSIEKQVDELYDEKGVEEVRLVRYWNSSREGGVDDVTYFAKGGNVQFRKLAKSKNFDIVTDEGRYEIEMGAFDMPKNIIDGDTRKEINTHPIAKKYRSEIQKYLDDNYAEGGLIEIDGKMYRVITKHRYNSDGIYEPFDVYEEVEKNSYAEGGEITVDDVDEWEVISDWASWKEIYPKYNVSYGQVVSDISDFLAFFMGDSEEDEHEIWKKRYNLKVVDKQTMRSLEKELWEHLVKKAKEENAFQDYVDFWNKSNKKRMADIPENYYFVREDNDNYVYVFKHKGTGKELKVNASHIGEITNKIHRLNKDRALQIHFDKKSGSTYAEGGELLGKKFKIVENLEDHTGYKKGQELTVKSIEPNSYIIAEEGDWYIGIEETDLDSYAEGGEITLKNFKYDPSIDYYSEYELLPIEIMNLIQSEKYVTEDYDSTAELSAKLLKEVEKKGWTFDYNFMGEQYSLRPIGEPEQEFSKGGSTYAEGGSLTYKNDKYYLLYEYDRNGRLVANSPKAVSVETTMNDWEHYQSETDLYEVITYPSKRKKTEHPTKIEIWLGGRKLEEYILSTLREKGGKLKVGDTVKWKYGNEHKVKEIHWDKSKIGEGDGYGTMVLLSNGQWVGIAEVTSKMASDTYAEGGEIERKIKNDYSDAYKNFEVDVTVDGNRINVYANRNDEENDGKGAELLEEINDDYFGGKLKIEQWSDERMLLTSTPTYAEGGEVYAFGYVAPRKITIKGEKYNIFSHPKNMTFTNEEKLEVTKKLKDKGFVVKSRNIAPFGSEEKMWQLLVKKEYAEGGKVESESWLSFLNW